jgi:GrpB-like predicted nucleotidyltransferase (UPF0157 family)
MINHLVAGRHGCVKICPERLVTRSDLGQTSLPDAGTGAKERHVPETGSLGGDVLTEPRATRSEAHEPSDRVQTTEAQLRAVTIGEPMRLSGPVELVASDPAWPRLFAREAERVRAALGDRVLVLEHVGSTAVPGLAAKPRIDLLLVVADSAEEAAYVPALEAAGYGLRIREPDWYEHRMFTGPDTAVNLHVFSPGCPEIERMLLFRDWLRGNEADRHLYEGTKRELAQREWAYVQQYADAKSTVVEAIIARARRDNGSVPNGDG